MERTCEYCGAKFEAQRKTARFCPGGKCKTYAGRKKATPRPIEPAMPKVAKSVNSAIRPPKKPVASDAALRSENARMMDGIFSKLPGPPTPEETALKPQVKTSKKKP